MSELFPVGVAYHEKSNLALPCAGDFADDEGSEVIYSEAESDELSEYEEEEEKAPRIPLGFRSKE